VGLKKGDLIRLKRTGEMATVMRGEYTARFIDDQDEEMIAHGMGAMAGTYGAAVDICNLATGRFRRKVKVSYATMEVVSLA